MEWTIFNFVSKFDQYRQFMSFDRECARCPADEAGGNWTYVIDALVRTPVTIFYGERAWVMLDRSKVFLAIMLVLGTACVVLSIVINVVVMKNYGSDMFQSLLYGWVSLSQKS